MENSESIVKLAKRRAGFDTSVGMIGAVMASESAGHEKYYLLVISVRYVLTGHDCRCRTRPNDSKVQEGRSPWFFLLFSWAEAICLLVYPMSHTYVHYPIADKKKIAELLRLKEVLFRCNLFSSEMDTCSIKEMADRALTVYNTALNSFLRATP